MTDCVDTVLGKLKGVKAAGPDKWMGCCPGHEDKHASLSVAKAANGAVLLKCHAGCQTKDIVQAMGLELRDLFPADSKRTRGRSAEIVATYDYRDKDGKLAYQVVRFEPKDFRQRRPDGKGGWHWNLNGVGRILYRLPDLDGKDPLDWVFICEGEKDCNGIYDLGGTATCNAGGAGNWGTLSDDTPLRGRRVCIIADKDKAGRKHAEDVRARLSEKAAAVHVLELPGTDVKDFSDWRKTCRRADPLAVLTELAENAGEWSPDAGTLDGLDAELEAEQRGERRPIPLPFAPKLTRLSRATVPGGVLVLGGSPGTAKSYLALNILVAALEAKSPASYLPLEGDRAFHLRRLAAILDGTWTALADPLSVQDAADLAVKVIAAHRTKLRAFGKHILENPCAVREDEDGIRRGGTVSAQVVLSLIEEYAKPGGLFILDPYSMIEFAGRNEWQGQNAFARRLVAVAAERKSILCVVAHLVKRPGRAASAPLTQDDIQGGSLLSRIAWAVLLIERYEEQSSDVEDAGRIWHNTRITIGKARGGERTGAKVLFKFGKHGPTFEEMGIAAKRKQGESGGDWQNEI